MMETVRQPSLAVTVLGSGTCVPSLVRSSCSLLVEIGSYKLLLDSGPGTMRRLLECGVSIFDLDMICYSHFHPDHTAELVPILFATKYPDENKRRKPLTIIAGRGFRALFKKLEAVYGEWIVLRPGMMTVIELDTLSQDLVRFEQFSISSAPVAHREESLAYRITARSGESMVYSGDTDVSENLVRLAAGADVFVCECAMPDALRVPGHLTPSLAGETASRANVRKLGLTHFYPECDQADVANECRSSYNGELVLARDRLKVYP